MMDFRSTPDSHRNLLQLLMIGILLGSIYAVFEYLGRIGSNDPQAFLPLLLRTVIAAILIISIVTFFESKAKARLNKKTFAPRVLYRSISYTLIISLILSVINGFWGIISEGFSFWGGIMDYVTDESYLINLLSILLALTVFIAIRQINSLHRKGELLDFVLGKYHEPKEVNRIFCFIDLKGSTTIGEKLGHYQFGLFLKDYYSDITDAIRNTEAEIYQYVGDEIVLCWSYEKGIKNNNMIKCFFIMKRIIHNLKEKYLAKYGVFPEFKAGLHGGKVMVTWVGEIKREIVFIGDVLNTTARIQEMCKQLSKDFFDFKRSIGSFGRSGRNRSQFYGRSAFERKEKKQYKYIALNRSRRSCRLERPKRSKKNECIGSAYLKEMIINLCCIEGQNKIKSTLR